MLLIIFTNSLFSSLIWVRNSLDGKHSRAGTESLIVLSTEELPVRHPLVSICSQSAWLHSAFYQFWASNRFNPDLHYHFLRNSYWFLLRDNLDSWFFHRLACRARWDPLSRITYYAAPIEPFLYQFNGLVDGVQIRLASWLCPISSRTYLISFSMSFFVLHLHTPLM